MVLVWLFTTPRHVLVAHISSKRGPPSDKRISDDSKFPAFKSSTLKTSTADMQSVWSREYFEYRVNRTSPTPKIILFPNPTSGFESSDRRDDKSNFWKKCLLTLSESSRLTTASSQWSLMLRRRGYSNCSHNPNMPADAPLKTECLLLMLKTWVISGCPIVLTQAKVPSKLRLNAS